jgi:hypothetical protein
VTRVAGRAVIALDPHRSGRGGLDAALLLAGDAPLELHGVFVEDENVFRLGGLPVREVVLGTAEVRAPSAAALVRQVRACLRDVQRGFEQAAAATRLPWSFEVLRGPLHEEIGRAAAGAELLVVEQARRLSRRPVGTGALARLLAVRGGDVAFVTTETVQPAGEVLWVDDGGPAGQRAGAIAGRSGRTTRRITLPLARPGRLAAEARLSGARLLVLPAGLFDPEDLARLLGQLATVVLLVRD